MNTDFGAYTREAREIAKKSREIARRIVGGDEPEDRIRQRCVIATGDPEVADLLRFNHGAITAGIKAIRRGARIYTDIRMVQVGITKQGHGCEVRCVLEDGAELAEEEGITRTSAGFLSQQDKLKDSIIVIGNSPSAALAVCRMVKDGISPALIVATPVGFINAAESKEEIARLDIPTITCAGTRGGTPIAVAIINELVAMANET